jgi:multidrug efflux pump subunit AcrA (membrane-fusion protein)
MDLPMRRLFSSRPAVVSAVVAVLLLSSAAWVYARERAAPASETGIVTVKHGDFKVAVTTSGELRAKQFVQITAPTNAQQAGAFQMKIQSIVPEGTVVKEGDVVAELDRSSLASSMQDVTLSLQKAQAQFQQAQLDTTLTLSKAREDMRSMELALEEKRIAKEQAVYEAPSIRRQAEIDFEKATRALAQAKLDYKTKGEQAVAKMSEVMSDRSRFENRLKVVQDVMGSFTIRAPAGGGMVIYMKEWNGRKKGAGSQITPWDPTVATLPDLTQMESITYVNEIDVRKLAVDQKVNIVLDADPTKKLPGKIVQVANVGEQRPNSDAKVFEVRVSVEKADTTLRPGMTTSNAVETQVIPKALFVPIEAVQSDSGRAFVFKREGSKVVKQEVLTGAMNDNEIVITKGLAKDDRVMLAVPANAAQLAFQALPAGSKPVPSPRTPADSAVPTPVKATPEKSAPAKSTPQG